MLPTALFNPKTAFLFSFLSNLRLYFQCRDDASELEKTTPFGINLMGSQVLYRLAKFPQINNHSNLTHYTIYEASEVAAWRLSLVKLECEHTL